MRSAPTAIAIAALVAGVALAVAALVAPRPEASDREAAGEVWVLRGLDASLRDGPPGEPVRVRLLVARQPLLRAASRPSVRRALARPVPHAVRAAARSSPDRITSVERRFARRARRARSAAIRDLRPAARRALGASAPLRRAVGAAGGRIIGASPLLAGVVARVPRGSLDSLVARDDMQAILPEPPRRPQLDVAAQAIGAAAAWDLGHTGGSGAADTVPAVAAVLSEAPDPSHPAFAGLTIDNPEPDPRITDHGTRTAGVLASQHATWRGIAHGVDRLIGAGQDTTGTWDEDFAYAVGVPSPKGPGAAEPAGIVSTSFATGMLDDETGVTRDIVINAFDVALAAAAGNNGPSIGGVESGYDNGLVVAALDDDDTAASADDSVWESSARGPTPGGRKKPDLIAPGVGITTAQLGGGFASFTGTSYSTPMVGGALALLHGAGVSDPRAARAILVNSAREWPGQAHWQPHVGWGVLDSERALAERGNTLSGSVEGGGARFYRAHVPTDAKATLAWNRRGIYGSGWPGPTGFIAFGRANLDLHQYRASDLSEVAPPSDPGHGAGPDALSANDTVEQVRAPAGGTQEVIYKVKAASEVAECLVPEGADPCEGDETEPFAIAAAAPLTELAAPSARPVELELSAEGTVGCLAGPGDIEVTVRARNESEHLDAHDAELTLELPEGASLVAGPATQQVGGGALGTGETSGVHSWVVRASSSGTKRLILTGSAGTMGETFAASEPVSFDADCTPPGVVPTDLGRSPAGSIACDTEVTISARLRNPSALDVGDARVTLALPAGAALVGGAPTQQVAGGTLAAGATSPAHTWRVRQHAPGSVAATIVGRGSVAGESLEDVRKLAFDCHAVDPPDSPDGDPGPPAEPRRSRLRGPKPRLRRGRIVARGRVVGRGRPRGRVRVLVRHARRGKRRAIRRLGRARRFRARIRICRPGRWTVRARYLGSRVHRPSAIRLGRVRARPRALRC